MEPMSLTVSYADTPGHHSSHFHDCHQLIHVVRGQVRATVSGQEYRLTPGTTLLISRFERHSLYVESAEYCRYTLRIEGQLPEDPLFSMLINRPADFSHMLDMSACPELEPLLAKMAWECRERLPMHQQMLTHLLGMLLTLLCRHHPRLNAAQTLPLVQRIQRLFESSCHQSFTLENLARRFHVSQSYLCHRFKETTGQSVMGYLAACRMAAAKRLLTETAMPVGDVVTACGFTDSSNFSRSFRRDTGMTPSEFRKKFLQSQ